MKWLIFGNEKENRKRNKRKFKSLWKGGMIDDRNEFFVFFNASDY